MTTGKQIDTKATCMDMRLLAKTSKFIRALAPVFTDVRTPVSSSVRTTASLETAETVYARRNMLQTQSVAVEARHSACRESRSATKKIFTHVGSYVQQLPTFGQLNERS